MDSEITKLREELAEQRTAVENLRSELVEQEHRLFPILKTFFIARKKWPKDDPRRNAAWKALLWRTFFSPGAAAGAAGIVGLATVILLAWQNSLAQQSVEQAQLQLAETRAQYQQSRKTDLIAFMYEKTAPRIDVAESTEEKRPEPRANARTRSEAVVEYISIVRGENPAAPGEEPFRVNLSNALLSDGHLSGADLRNADLIDANLTGTNLYLADLSGAKLGNANLNGADLMGAVLIDADFIGADLSKANLSNAELIDASLHQAVLIDAVLIGADLRNADLSNAVLIGADLHNADFIGADLRGANLSYNPVSRSCTDLSGVTGLTCDRLRTARNWSEAFRDEDLACGEPIPELDF